MMQVEERVLLRWSDCERLGMVVPENRIGKTVFCCPTTLTFSSSEIHCRLLIVEFDRTVQKIIPMPPLTVVRHQVTVVVGKTFVVVRWEVPLIYL